jgi:hypothetical protein
MKSHVLILIILFGSTLQTANAQSPVNGFMQKKGNGSVVLSHNFESYNTVFLVPEKITGVPIFNEITLNSTSIYATYGLNDRLNVVLNVPYIQAKGAANAEVLENLNYRNTQSGFQDISAYVKYKALTVATEKTTFNLIGSVGIKTPLGNYTVDEGLQSIVSIGNRATSLNALMIGLLRSNSGLFASGQVGYCLKNNQVPNAVMSEFKAGLIQPNFYFDAFIANQTSLSGTDILAEGFQGFFPSTKVNYTRIGLNVFVPIYRQFGLCAGSSTYIDGRNLGQSTSYYGAISVSF